MVSPAPTRLNDEYTTWLSKDVGNLANEEKERARIDAQQREFAQNASYIARATEIEENYRNITEVWIL